MRSKKMKHKKRQRYHLVGGNFIDNINSGSFMFSIHSF